MDSNAEDQGDWWSRNGKYDFGGNRAIEFRDYDMTALIMISSFINWKSKSNAPEKMDFHIYRTIYCTIIGRLSHPINADNLHCSVVHVKMFIALSSFTIFRLYCFQATLSLSIPKK